MNMKKVVIGSIAVLVVVSGLLMLEMKARADTNNQIPPDVSAKLDDILNNERQILQALDSMKQELKILQQFLIIKKLALYF